MEAVLKILALKGQYFRSAWNDFDLLVLVLSMTGIILEFMNVNLMVTPNVLRVMRVLRIGRLLRFFEAAKGIRRQLVALFISLPALFNIGTLLFLTLFIYSIIGMTSFGHVKKQGVIDNVINFETFGQSMLVLFRLATSAGWNEVLDALMVQPPNCDPTYKGLPNGNCGKPLLAVVYMVTFILVTFMVIVNMYIAVILENFNQATEDEEIGITDDDIQMFYTYWQKYDPHATQYIDFLQLSDFLDELEPPLQIQKPNDVACLKLDIPIRDNDKIHCADVLLGSLKHNVVGHLDETDEETFKFISSTIEAKLLSAFPVRAKDPTTSTTAQKIQEVQAAITIQTLYKRWRRRKQSMEKPQTVSIELHSYSATDSIDTPGDANLNRPTETSISEITVSPASVQDRSWPPLVKSSPPRAKSSPPRAKSSPPLEKSSPVLTSSKIESALSNPSPPALKNSAKKAKVSVSAMNKSLPPLDNSITCSNHCSPKSNGSTPNYVRSSPKMTSSAPQSVQSSPKSNSPPPESVHSAAKLEGSKSSSNLPSSTQLVHSELQSRHSLPELASHTSHLHIQVEARNSLSE
eukprot:Seg1660.2 transcript_id=Seg1660.2/GoldUCD/mRNA.D3Y31 product="Sodium channel protein 60E" protein_id=Seg1660.2/GoldUCD/D3Y31